MITRGTGNKAYENFKLRCRRDTYFTHDIFFMPTSTLVTYSATLPSGVLVYNTTTNKNWCRV
jgi:hypothetical protein